MLFFSWGEFRWTEPFVRFLRLRYCASRGIQRLMSSELSWSILPVRNLMYAHNCRLVTVGLPHFWSEVVMKWPKHRIRCTAAKSTRMRSFISDTWLQQSLLQQTLINALTTTKLHNNQYVKDSWPKVKNEQCSWRKWLMFYTVFSMGKPFGFVYQNMCIMLLVKRGS